jgi:hypothetical protein
MLVFLLWKQKLLNCVQPSLLRNGDETYWLRENQYGRRPY